jgi:glycosyltransferase involved in cell wall biosynthesis
MSALDESADSKAWISKIALCKGLLEPDVDELRIARDYAILRRLVPQLPVPSPHFDTSFAAITAYSAEIGLKSFVIAGPKPAEYRIVRTAAEPKYQKTERAVRTWLQSGRPRIAAPRRLFGNVICKEPEHVGSVHWCMDLLRAGYLSIHIPTDMGPQRISLLRQLMANIAQRLPLQRKVNAPSREADSDRYAALDRLARSRRPNYEPEPGCVLLVASDLGCGGSERQMLALSSGLVERGYHVRLVVLKRTRSGQPDFESEFLRLGVVPQYAMEFDIGAEAGFSPLAAVPLGSALSKLRRPFSVVVPELIRAIRKYRPQIVHAWLNSPGLAGALAATSLGTPRVVVQFGSMSLQHTGHYRRLHDYFLRGFRAIARNPTVSLAANSAAGALDYAQWLDLPREQVHVIKNGFMSETVRTPSKRELWAYRSQLKIPADVPVVGTITRFVEEKDPGLWLDAAVEIAKLNPRAWFVLAGYGELLEDCKERAKALGLHRVVFPGPVKDVGLIYKLLDVFLLTSRVEGLPNVLIEAQAAGCPVVTTAVGGTGEALIDGVTGRIVGERSPEAIASAVLDILADPTWPARMRKDARDFIADRFGVEKMVEETLRAYQAPLHPRKNNSRTANPAPVEAIKIPIHR